VISRDHVDSDLGFLQAGHSLGIGVRFQLVLEVDQPQKGQLIGLQIGLRSGIDPLLGLTGQLAVSQGEDTIASFSESHHVFLNIGRDGGRITHGNNHFRRSFQQILGLLVSGILHDHHTGTQTLWGILKVASHRPCFQ
jgi:hypothetical protein